MNAPLIPRTTATTAPRTTTTTTTTTPVPRGGSIDFGDEGTASGTYQPTLAEGTCGTYLGTGHIIGGEVTKRGELPYLAALGYRSSSGEKTNYNCGGTLINRQLFQNYVELLPPK